MVSKTYQGVRVASIQRRPQVGNGCGTLAAALVVSAFEGQPVSQAEVDKAIRRWPGYTAPAVLVAYLRRRLGQAQAYNRVAPAELQAMLDEGNLVISLGNAPEAPHHGAHYEVIYGYRQGPDTALMLYTTHLHTPAGVVGAEGVAWDTLTQLGWWRPRVWGLSGGYDRLMIVACNRQTVWAGSTARPARLPWCHGGVARVQRLGERAYQVIARKFRV